MCRCMWILVILGPAGVSGEGRGVGRGSGADTGLPVRGGGESGVLAGRVLSIRRRKDELFRGRCGYDGGMDVSRTDLQARALASTRRILAVIKLEVSGSEDALTEQDRDLIKGYDAEQLAEDLRLFAGWHEGLGTDPEAALAEMRSRVRGGSSA